MPFYRVVMIVESKLDNEDDVLEELLDRPVGKTRIVEVEEVEFADDYENDDDEDIDESELKGFDPNYD